MLLLLAIRGVGLWIVVPLTAVLWVVLLSAMLPRGIGFRVLLGWGDLNVVALVQRSVLRWGFPNRQPWIPIGGIAATTHRVRFRDAV